MKADKKYSKKNNLIAITNVKNFVMSFWKQFFFNKIKSISLEFSF